MPLPRKPSKKGRDSRGSKSTAKQKDSAEGITGISVRGYKSLAKECNIEIRPLTILAGANSSGKSSAIQPLLLLKQTLEATYDPGALLLHGPNVRFTDAHQVLSTIPGQPAGNAFSVNLRTEEGDLGLLFKRPEKKPFELREMTFKSVDESITFRPRMSHKEIISILPEDLRKLLVSSSMKGIKGKAQWRTFRMRCFFVMRPYLVSGKHEEYLPLTVSPSGHYERHVRDVIHVPGLRGNPERTYTTTRIGQTFHGTFEKYVASVINHWQNENGKRIGQLEDALALLGLTWRIKAEQIDDAHVELRVGRTAAKGRSRAGDLVNIADTGFGVSQVLAVLVALLTAKRGQLVYLEQPEIHLHPRAQVALAEVLADAAKRGVRVVAETHSATMLLAIQTLVAKGDIAPKIIKLHWFKRRPQDGITDVISADLDDVGAFGEWPEDFADVALAAESKYLDAAEARRGLADMAKKTSRRLVIDASVARAAGPEGATFPTSKNCRDFLEAVRTICHRVVMTQEISEQWKRHMSRFSRKWRVSMEAKKKVCRIGSVPDDDLRARILNAASSQKERDTLSKDTLLIEAALATDSAIAALDDTALRAFRKAANSVRRIRRIVWINPDKTDERPIAWLEKGARIERTRQLRPNR